MRGRVGVVGREQQRDQVGAERARQILELLLDDLGLAAQDLDARGRGLRALDERVVDGDHVGPRARLGRERDEHLAGVVAIGRPRERGEHVGHRALGVVGARVEDARAAQVQLDALGGGRGGERDLVGVEHAAPRDALVEVGGEPLDLGEQPGVARRDRERLGGDRLRARAVAEPALADAGELARPRHEPLGLGRRAARAERDQPLALVGEDLGELAPQAVRLGGAAHVGERVLVGRLVVRAPPPPERAARIAELVGGGRGDPLDQRAPVLGVLGGLGAGRQLGAARREREHALDHRDVLLPPAELGEQLGGGGERLVLIGVELEHALERLQRARGVAEAVAAGHADLEPARDLPLGLGRQVHLALGDPHGGVEVAARLVQPAQRGVRLEVVGIELADQLVEHLDRLAGRAEPLLEDLGALDRGGARALAVARHRRRDQLRRDQLQLRAEHVGELAPLAGAAVQPHERGERVAVLGRELEHAVPRADRARRVADVRVDHHRVALELERAQPALGRAGLGQRAAAVEALEHLRELGPALVALVQLGQRGERVGIRRRRAQRLLPAVERGEVVLARGGEPREPLEQLGALGGRAGRRCVVLERLLEPRIAGLLEHALHALERVAVAAQQLEHGARRVDHAVDVGEPRLVQHGEPAQLGQALGALGDRPLLGRVLAPARADHLLDDAALVELEDAAQRRGEPGVVALALVQLGQRLERRVVVGQRGADLLVQLDRAARIDLPLAVGLRHLAQRVQPLRRIGRGRHLVLEAGDQLLPHLRARVQAAQRLGDLGAAGLELGDALPRVDRRRDVAEPQLGELRDLLEPAHDLVGLGAGLAQVVERELEQIDQAAPVAALAEVIDVARERLLVRRHHAERLVEQLGGAVAVALVLARDGRELEQLGDERLGGHLGVLRERVELGLDEARQRVPLLVLAQQLAQLARGLAAGRLVRDEVGEHLDQPVAVGELVAVQRGAPPQQPGALVGILDDRAAVAQVAVELVPLRGVLQRLLERGGAGLRARVDADGAAQVVDAARVVVRGEPAAADLGEQLAGLVAPRPRIGVLAEPGAGVDLGELLGDLGRRRVELGGLLEVAGGGLEVAAAQREHAELVADLRLARDAGGRVADDVELGLVQLGDHPVVAERGVQLARGVEGERVVRLELPRLLPVPQRAVDAAEVVVPQLGGAAVLRGAPRDQLVAAALAVAARRLGELGELVLDHLDGGRRVVGLDDLEQAIGRAVVGGVELERGAQVLDRGRGLAEHEHRLAGLRPRVGRAHRIALVLRPRRAQLGEQLPAPRVAQLLAQLGEALRLRLLPEDPHPLLERVDRCMRRRVVRHPQAGPR